MNSLLVGTKMGKWVELGLSALLGCVLAGAGFYITVGSDLKAELRDRPTRQEILDIM